MERQPRFAITGSGRSGSKYISRLLRATGINCGHEEYWGLEEPQGVLDGDSSWIATFDRGFSGDRFAQVRNPLQSVPSIYANEIRSDWYGLLRRQNVWFTGDDNIDAVRVWNTYTHRAIKTSQHWWRVEDVSIKDLNMIATTVEKTLINPAVAIEAVSRNTNSKLKKDFEWPDCRDTEEAMNLAKKLGYRID